MCVEGFAGAGIAKAAADLGHRLIRPAREDEPGPALPFPGWLRQRILALSAVIWHNWTIGAPVERSLIPYDH
ncbi:hypothetical protein [Nonomuraea sp. NPDC050783]|uniref:hypothetical protein n=1 Tax=Nonomuraea sp. NPDC050783 TaxID=3154634 RepID=UPI003465944B